MAWLGVVGCEQRLYIYIAIHLYTYIYKIYMYVYIAHDFEWKRCMKILWARKIKNKWRKIKK